MIEDFAKKRDQLVAERERLIARINVLNGAIALCDEALTPPAPTKKPKR